MTTPKPRWLHYLPAALRSRIEHRPNLLAILSNTGWLFADKILRMGVGLFVGVWIARYLGPEQYGLWNFAIAFVALFGAFATLGLDSIVVRELVKNPERQNELLGTAFALKLIGAVIAIILAVTAIAFVRSGETLTLWLVLLSAAGFIFQSFNVIDFYFQANVKSRYTVYAANAAFILMTLVKVVLLISSAPLIAFAWVGFCEVVLTSLFLMTAYRVNDRNMYEWGCEWITAKKLLKESWPLIVSGFVIMIYMRIDQIMLGQMQNDESVGVYSAAVRISEVWYFIPAAIVSSVFPSLIKDKNRSELIYYRRLQKLYDFLILLSLLFAILISFISDWLMIYLFGNNYAGSAKVLLLLIWTCIPVSIGIAWSQWILIENKQNLAVFSHIFGALINIFLNFILIPLYGPIGCAIATLIAYFLSCLLAFSLYKGRLTYSLFLHIGYKL